uniref:Uncharacterized protein n=1 Tax=Cucumis melo TaxID=3656 RepID=A0A9I9DBL5_CUCME
MASQMALGVRGAPDFTSVRDSSKMMSGVRGAFDAVSDSSGMASGVRGALDIFKLR